MREIGFEPIPLAGLDPKSSASANSATLAALCPKGLRQASRCRLDNCRHSVTIGSGHGREFYQVRRPRASPAIGQGRYRLSLGLGSNLGVQPHGHIQGSVPQ